LAPCLRNLIRNRSAIFERYHYRDWLQGIVEFVAGGGDDLVYYVHASEDFAEDGVGPVQSTGVRDTDMALL
jgi:hypothetical protein